MVAVNIGELVGLLGSGTGGVAAEKERAAQALATYAQHDKVRVDTRAGIQTCVYACVHACV